MPAKDNIVYTNNRLNQLSDQKTVEINSAKCEYNRNAELKSRKIIN